MEKQNIEQKANKAGEMANGMKRFADEVTYTVSDRISEAKDDLTDAVSKGKKELVKMAKKDLKQIEKWGYQMADFGVNSLNSVKTFAKKRPVTALAIAAGVSALAVGLMTRSANKRRGG